VFPLVGCCFSRLHHLIKNNFRLRRNSEKPAAYAVYQCFDVVKGRPVAKGRAPRLSSRHVQRQAQGPSQPGTQSQDMTQNFSQGKQGTCVTAACWSILFVQPRVDALALRAIISVTDSENGIVRSVQER